MIRSVFAPRLLALVLLSAGASTAAPAWAQASDPATPSQAADRAEAADAILAELLSAGAPAAALVVVGPDGPLAVEVAGTARRGGTAVMPAQAWHIGSNAKAMTATLALALEADGVLSLDDSVPDLLGETYAVDDGWDGVTLRDLLRHRGGAAPNIGRLTMVRYILTGAEDGAGAAKERAAVLRGTLRRPPEGEVGTYAYSNLGYTIAGAMMEAAAGARFDELLETYLFAPLGMKGVVLGAPRGEGVIVGHRGASATPVDPGEDNPLLMAPAGTFSLPPAAYAAFLTDQLRGQMGRDALLPPDAYKAMATPPEGGTYGLGWGVREDGTLGHSGSNTMWYATARLVPERGLAVAVLTNWGARRDLGPQIDAALDAFSTEGN